MYSVGGKNIVIQDVTITVAEEEPETSLGSTRTISFEVTNFG